MGSLAGRRILVVGRDYFFYTRSIVQELRATHGAHVTFVPIAPEHPVYSAFKRIPGAAAWWLRRYHRATLARLRHETFDTVLFIQVHQLEDELVARYRQVFASARFILYYWDSLRTHDYRPYLRHFDAAWSFDPEDVRQDSRLSYLPLFYCEQFHALRARTDFSHDLVFIGTALNLQRYERVEQFREWARRAGIVFHDYLYVSPIFYLRQLLRGRRLRDVHFRTMSAEQLLDLYGSSRAILDLPGNHQAGFTMRTFEALGAGRKLVTTQASVAGQPFFDPKAVFVLGLHGEFPPKAFLRTTTPPPSGIERHALQQWLVHLLSPSRAPDAALDHQPSRDIP